eukprot:768593-Hanusia_phi.AAC.2
MIKLHYTNDGASIDPLAAQGKLFIRSKQYTPTFTVNWISDSSQIAGSQNVISVTVRPNFELQSNLNLTISGLISSGTPDGEIHLSDACPWLSYTSAWWSQTEGVLVVQLSDPSSLPVDRETFFSFTLTNGLVASKGVVPWVSAEFQNVQVNNFMSTPKGRVLKVLQNSLFVSTKTSLCKQSNCPASTVCGAPNFITVTLSPILARLQDFFLSITISSLSHDDWFLKAPVSTKIGSAQAVEMSGSWDPYKKEIQLGPFSALELGEEMFVGFEAKNQIVPSPSLSYSLVQVRAFQSENVTAAGPAQVQQSLFVCNANSGVGNVVLQWETSLCRKKNKFSLSIALNSPLGDEQKQFAVILSGLAGFRCLASDNIVVVTAQNSSTSWDAIWNDDGLLLIFPQQSGGGFFISAPFLVLEFELLNPQRIQSASTIGVRIAGATTGFDDVVLPQVAVFNPHDTPLLVRSEVVFDVSEPWGLRGLRVNMQSNADLQPGDELHVVLPGFEGPDMSASTAEFVLEWNQNLGTLRIQVSTCLLHDEAHSFELSAYLSLTPPYHLSSNFPSLRTYLVKDQVKYGPFATQHNSITCSTASCSALPVLSDVIVSSCSSLASIQFDVLLDVPEALGSLSFSIQDFQSLLPSSNVTVCGPNSSAFEEVASWSSDMQVLTLRSKAGLNVSARGIELSFIVSNGPVPLPSQNLTMTIVADVLDTRLTSNRTAFLSVTYPIPVSCIAYFIEPNKRVGSWSRRDMHVERGGNTNFYVTLQPNLNLPNNSAITLRGLNVAYRRTTASLNVSFGTFALNQMLISRNVSGSWFDDQGLVFSVPFPMLADQNVTFAFSLESNCLDLATLNVSIDLESSLNSSWVKIEPIMLDMYKTDIQGYHQPEIVSLKVKLNTWTHNLSYVQMHLSLVLSSPLPANSTIGIGGLGISQILQTDGFEQVGQVTESFDVIHFLRFSQELEACRVVNASMVVRLDTSFFSTDRAYAYLTSSETRVASCDYLDFNCIQPIVTPKRFFELDVKYLHCDSQPSSFVSQDLNESYVVQCPGNCHEHGEWREYPNLICSRSIPEYIHADSLQYCMSKCMESQGQCKALFWRSNSDCLLFYQQCSLANAFSEGSTWIPPANKRQDYQNVLLVASDGADLWSDREISVYKMSSSFAPHRLIAGAKSNSTESVSWFQISNRTFVFGRSRVSCDLYILDFVTPELILHRSMNGSRTSSLFVINTIPFLVMILYYSLKLSLTILINRQWK